MPGKQKNFLAKQALRNEFSFIPNGSDRLHCALRLFRRHGGYRVWAMKRIKGQEDYFMGGR